MPSAYSKRKRQTRLAFTPLSDSSPARASAPKSIRDRAAAVTIDGSPSAKRRRVEINALPTPEASSLVVQDNQSDAASPPPPKTRSFMSTQEKDKNGKKPKRRKTKHIELASFDSSSDSDVLTRTTPRSAQRTAKTVTSEQEDGEESDVPIRSSQRRRSTIIEISDESESEQNGNNDDDDSVTVEGSDEEDEVPVTARGRGNIRITSTSRKKHDSEQEDLEEDLEFLGDADVETPRARRHDNATPKKKTAKQKALEALKRRRTKQAGIDLDDEGSGDDYSSGSDAEETTADASLFRADDYDEDFVVDEDDTLGAPVELPFEFSSFRTRKTKDLFKFVVEWMVQKKINPAFRMEDDVYRIAFDRTNDYVKGMGGSKFQSSAWTSEFLRALKGRPVLEEDSISGMGLIEHCAACNRTGHPATFEVRFTGNTYDRESLEEHSDDEGDDEVPSPDTIYYVGRFCMQNARTAHSFQHWKFHLNEWVVDYLRNEGHLSAGKIVERDRWNTKKRREYANSVVDHMEANGEIKTLYRDFKNEISQAQESTQGRYEMSSP